MKVRPLRKLYELGASIPLPSYIKEMLKRWYIVLTIYFDRNFIEFEYESEVIDIFYTNETFNLVNNAIHENKILSESIDLDVIQSDVELDAVIDVGAHHGLYSILLKLLNPEAKLYSFEPNDYNKQILADFVDVNRINGYISGDVVTDMSGNITFYENKKDGAQSHSTHLRDSGDYVAVEKSTTAISDLIEEENLDKIFIKIDAEGEEFKILKDIKRSSTAHLEGIVELHPDKMDVTEEGVVDYLESNYSSSKFLCETDPNYEYNRPMYYFRK